MTSASGRLYRKWLPISAGLGLLPACVQDFPSPDVGSCADYPDGAYDYGEIGIGTCLGNPTDLKVVTTAGKTSLLVVNADTYMTFRDGSLLSIDLDAVTQELDTFRDLFPAVDGEQPIPTVLLMDDPVLGATAVSLPRLNGQLALANVPDNGCGDGSGEGCPVGFITNRLSDTTQQSIRDFVYTVDLADPSQPALFNVEGTGQTTDLSDARFVVQEDPYGVAASDNQLYVVNEQSHTVSMVDLQQYPLTPTDSDDIGLLTQPVFADGDAASFAEMANLSVTTGVEVDSWTLRYLDGTYRAWHTEADGIYWSESHNGRTFDVRATSPLIEAGSGTDWDAGELGRASALLFDDRYYFFYEATSSETNGSVRGIGMAQTSSSLAGSVTKYDVNTNANGADDALVSRGVTGTFDAGGVGDPWVDTYNSTYTLWYTGYDDDDVRSLGRIQSDDLTSWEDRKPLEFFSHYTRATSSTAGSYQASDAVTFEQARDPSAFFDETIDRWRLWFVSEQDDGASSCLVYAESELNTYQFRVGALEQPAITGDGCLEIPQDAVVRSPSVVSDGRSLFLWYLTSPDPEAGPWTMHAARGFDGVHWYPVAEPVEVDGLTQLDIPAFVPLKVEAGAAFTLEGERRGPVSGQLTTQAYLAALSDTFRVSMLTGHVLGAGTTGTIADDPSDTDLASLDAPSWDSEGVGEPFYDAASDVLYYAGQLDNDLVAIGAAAPRDPLEVPARMWTNSAAPILSDDVAITGPAVVHTGNRTFLYVSQLDDGENGTLYRSEQSNDGTFGTPVVVLAPSDALSVESWLSPTVLGPIAADPLWHLWVTGVTGSTRRIFYASSSDGLTWTLRETPVLQTGVAGEWDDVSVEAPSVVRFLDDAGQVTGYRLYYQGYDSASYRIGMASAAAAVGSQVGALSWTRINDQGQSGLVFSASGGWWDEDHVASPQVWFDGDRYWLMYEGIRWDAGLQLHRVGLASSFDGQTWTRTYAPLTADDHFTFRTSTVLEGTASAEGTGQVAWTVDGALGLSFTLNGSTFSGRGATQVIASPEKDIAIVAARYSNGFYVMDTRDDSSDTFFDANYHGIEAVVVWSSSTAYRSIRSAVFSPDGNYIYAITANPDSVLIFDRTLLEDQSSARVIFGTMLVGTIPLDPGLEEDEGSSTSSDAGPTALTLSRDGRYLWVSHGNANAVYTIDLTSGGGEVVHVARSVGEMPSALALTPDERYLVVANHLGETFQLDNNREESASTLTIIDADRLSPTFGYAVAYIKNIER